MKTNRLNIFAALAVLALASPAHAQTQADSTESLVQHALSFIGLEPYELPGKIDSIAQVSEVVAKSYPVPFLGKTLEGKTITRIVIDSVDLARRKHVLTDKERDDLFRLTIDVDPSTGALLSISCRNYHIKEPMAKEKSTEEAERDLALERYDSFVQDQSTQTFLDALESAVFARPYQAGEIDAILVRYGHVAVDTLIPAWILTIRGGLTIQELTGRKLEYPDHLRVLINAETGQVFSIGNSPPQVDLH